MTDKPTDAVAQARAKYDECVWAEADIACDGYGKPDTTATEAAWAEVLAAVRAECAAKVLDAVTHENVVADLPVRGARPEAAEYVADVLLCVRKRIRKTLKEAP